MGSGFRAIDNGVSECAFQRAIAGNSNAGMPFAAAEANPRSTRIRHHESRDEEGEKREQERCTGEEADRESEGEGRYPQGEQQDRTRAQRSSHQSHRDEGRCWRPAARKAAARTRVKKAAPKKPATGYLKLPNALAPVQAPPQATPRAMAPKLGTLEQAAAHQPGRPPSIYARYTLVPPRGHTALHGSQSERTAAAKGQRARMSNRRKH